MLGVKGMVNSEKNLFELFISKHLKILALLLGAILIFLGLTVTPELLIKLGPLKGSLTHPSELVRETTILEINIIKYFLIVAGSLLPLIAYFQDKIIRSLLMARIREVRELPRPFNKANSAIYSLSLKYMVSISILTILCFYFGAEYLPQRTMYFIFSEDGLIEYSTALAFFFAAVVSSWITIIAKPSHLKLFPAFLTVLFMLCVAEEISWGQRIIGFETPESIAKINAQNEMNLHNMFGYFADHLFIAGVFIWGFLLPLLVSYLPTLHKTLYLMGLPIPSGGLAVGFLIASSIHAWTIGYPGGDTNLRPAEVREFLSSVGFFILMLEHAKIISSESKLST